jgi:hypothetical protein
VNAGGEGSSAVVCSLRVFTGSLLRYAACVCSR